MNILVIIGERWAIHDEYGAVLTTSHKARLEKVGKVFHIPLAWRKDGLEEALARTHPEVLIPFWGSPKVTMEIHRKFPELKYICNPGGGLRGAVDRDVLADGVLATNWGDGISYSIAEAALMMTLSTLRRTTKLQFDIHQRGLWPTEDTVRPQGLFYRKVGLHGLGLIAQDFVKLLKPFHCDVSAYSPHCPDSVFQELGVRRVTSLKQLYAENSVVSVHASKTDENFHIVNKGILAAMQDGAVLVNTARGAVIDTDALVAELKSGRIHASLDVFEQEPLPKDHPLRGLENCQLISHMGGPTPDQRRFLGDIAVDNIERYARGEKVRYAVSAEKYDLMT